MKHQDIKEQSDRDIVVYARHNPETFGVLMERYEARLLRYIHRTLHVAREDAEDILQESFLKAYQNLNDFDTTLSFSSWMYRITHNTAISAWRKNKTRPQGNSVDVDDDFWLRISAENDDVVRELDRSFDRKKIANVFAAMDEKYRSVLVLYYMEEKSYKEMSDILKKPMGTIATLINRAKKHFRAQCAHEDILF